MTTDLQQTVALLAHTPAALDAWLRDLPEIWTTRNEGADTWSPLEGVRHLVHAERPDWMRRVRMILQSGEPEAFTPFDRQGNLRESQGVPLADVLDEFA